MAGSGTNRNENNSKNRSVKKPAAGNNKDVAVSSAKKPDETFRELKEPEYRMYSPCKDKLLVFQDYVEEILCSLKSLSRFVVLAFLIIAFMIFEFGIQ